MISKSYTGRIIWGTVTKYKEMCWSLLWQNLSHYIVRSVENLLTQHLRNTAQKLKFSIKDFFSKCYKIRDQIRPKTIISCGNFFSSNETIVLWSLGLEKLCLFNFYLEFDWQMQLCNFSKPMLVVLWKS